MAMGTDRSENGHDGERLSKIPTSPMSAPRRSNGVRVDVSRLSASGATLDSGVAASARIYTFTPDLSSTQEVDCLLLQPLLVNYALCLLGESN